MLNIDRVGLADCFTPDELVSEIFSQSPHLELPIPVVEIAKECGILECLPLKLKSSSFTGALVSDGEKDYGVIFYIEYPKVPGRERFTIAHELGHHLLQHHSSEVFCGKIDDVNEAGKKEEDEADSFATQLLMPKHLIEDYLQSNQITLESIKALSGLAVTSVAATVKRSCVILTGSVSVVFVFSKDGFFRYADSSDELLKGDLSLFENDRMPENSQVVSINYAPETFTNPLTSKFSDWFCGGDDVTAVVSEQVYFQENGYAVTLLLVNH